MTLWFLIYYMTVRAQSQSQSHKYWSVTHTHTHTHTHAYSFPFPTTRYHICLLSFAILHPNHCCFRSDCVSYSWIFLCVLAVVAFCLIRWYSVCLLLSSPYITSDRLSCPTLHLLPGSLYSTGTWTSQRTGLCA